MEKRICTVCKLEKDIDEFSWRNKNKNKRASECKECHKNMRYAHYEENRKREIKSITKRKKEIKEWLTNLKKELKCQLCPESNPVCLDFHHKNKEDKDLEIGCVVQYGWSKDRILKEIEKCICVCSNCHRKIHAGVAQW